MNARERTIYVLSIVLAILSTVLPLLAQLCRIWEFGVRSPFVGAILEISILIFFNFFLLPAAPLFVIGGIVGALVIRRRMASRGETGARPSLTVFIFCGLLWVVVRYTFKVLPLFPGGG